jgi:hypothetical protein
VANNKIDATKNAGKSTTISTTMRMRRCDAGNQGFTRSQWMLPSGKCLHLIAAAAAMVDDFGRKHKTLTKHYF